MKGRYRTTPRRKAASRPETVALMVVDNQPLQKAAWECLLRARKRLARATSDLHRHEQKDEPGYRVWIHSRFPELVSELRDLSFACESKRKIMQSVESEAFWRRTTPAVIWQRRKKEGDLAAAMDDEADQERNPFGDVDDDEGFDAFDDPLDALGSSFEELVDEILRERGIDPGTAEAEQVRDELAATNRGAETPVEREAKEIYRRLVQRLHPDRGGQWDAARERLWHEVQTAWEARDADWLSRLESEFEVLADVLGPQSPVGRLYAAIHEIDAARRDADRKVRDYRRSPAWRFTLVKMTERDIAAVRNELEDELQNLRRLLNYIESVIAGWEKPVGLSRAKKRVQQQPAPTAAQLEMF